MAIIQVQTIVKGHGTAIEKVDILDGFRHAISCLSFVNASLFNHTVQLLCAVDTLLSNHAIHKWSLMVHLWLPILCHIIRNYDIWSDSISWRVLAAYISLKAWLFQDHWWHIIIVRGTACWLLRTQHFDLDAAAVQKFQFCLILVFHGKLLLGLLICVVAFIITIGRINLIVIVWRTGWAIILHFINGSRCCKHELYNKSKLYYNK